MTDLEVAEKVDGSEKVSLIQVILYQLKNDQKSVMYITVGLGKKCHP